MNTTIALTIAGANAAGLGGRRDRNDGTGPGGLRTISTGPNLVPQPALRLNFTRAPGSPFVDDRDL